MEPINAITNAISHHFFTSSTSSLMAEDTAQYTENKITSCIISKPRGDGCNYDRHGWSSTNEHGCHSIPDKCASHTCASNTRPSHACASNTCATNTFDYKETDSNAATCCNNHSAAAACSDHSCPNGPPEAALPLPCYSYVCTVSEPVRTSVGYLPVDGMCDYMFYDSLYKNGTSNFLSGITQLELGPQYFIFKAVMYSKTKMGLSFAPEPVLLDTDSKNPKFFTVIDEIWGKTVSHFGFLNLYREYLDPDTVTQALTLLKELHLYLKPKTSTTRPSYYVIGLSLAGTSNIQILNLMRTVFTPSMFIAISHLSYPVRTFNDCRIFPVAMDVLPRHLVRGRDYTYGHTVSQGVYYAPKFANPSSPNPDEFQMFKPCQDPPKPYYDDPHNVNAI
ncbi:hypothetical protein HPB52_017106 [Rhipicephalus sanguineus]|uniref:Uncharacterized protein n=1 Tax=Rhipicephalus sanguineus TaxID=34632 RepID=A0A9D4PHC9_RHISA|nr:hypothetical protein HPB52_017106 [Rhipicephalus sanguineus]